MTQSLTGNLLVASTELDGEVFARSVCLVVHHDDDGAIGLMLNRPLHPQPAELLSLLGSEHSRVPAAAEGTVHFGGPLSGPVVALHALPALAESETSSGIYVAAQKDHLEKLMHQAAPMRLIVGHAGWASGQLEAEIAEGSWHVTPASPEIIFSPDEAMWARSIRHASGRTLARWVGARPVPSPELN
ncbi:YqgE/AlgH family protein [Roseimaritima sediminicola]|uniref:YqgE/AlgH family protein n=1 Tax=Roseimaritima sediminicola TaxID=2662066 RepID=UPI001298347D|nr:YqgE/AlgH family protein [Roseimaritima sediminicola]